MCLIVLHHCFHLHFYNHIVLAVFCRLCTVCILLLGSDRKTALYSIICRIQRYFPTSRHTATPHNFYFLLFFSDFRHGVSCWKHHKNIPRCCFVLKLHKCFHYVVFCLKPHNTILPFSILIICFILAQKP